jgi:ubiquinone/menaquinone biosynthesis C-methylase UbiE
VSAVTEETTMPEETGSRSYFAAVAESYDRLQPVLAGPGYEAGLQFVLQSVPHEPEDRFRCVELGCGTATLTARLLAAFPNACAVAIDGEPAMLEIARTKLGAHAGRVEVRQAEALSCDLPACDLMLSSYLFHHIPPEAMKAVFGRIADALKPGGCLLLLDQMHAGPEYGDRLRAVSRRLYRQRVEAAIAAGLTTQAEIDARWELKRRMKQEGQDVEYRHRAEDLLSAMYDAGFAEVGLVWRVFASTVLVGFRAG